MTTARDVLDACHKRWPDGDFVKVEEAPLTADRMGRKLDLVVLSCWQSRGFERIGVEVKVSVGDFRRELANAAKADGWWRRLHLFYVAVPEKIADKVRADLPPLWGLLVLSGNGTLREIVKPARTVNPTDLALTTWVGLLRAGVGTGRAALDRAHRAGFEEGRKHGEAKAVTTSTDERFEALRAKVEAFEQATGLSLGDHRWPQEGRRLGEAVNLLGKAHRDPRQVSTELGYLHDALARAAADVSKVSAALVAAVDAAWPEDEPAAPAPLEEGDTPERPPVPERAE